MKLEEIIEFIDEKVPKSLALDFDEIGFKKEYDLSLSVEDIMTGINQTIEHFYIHEVLPKPGVVDFLKQMKKSLHK